MQAVGRGVEADVRRDRPLLEAGREPRRGVVDEAAGGHGVEEGGHGEQT